MRPTLTTLNANTARVGGSKLQVGIGNFANDGEPMKEAIEVMAADVLDRNQRIAELGNEIERLRECLKERDKLCRTLEAEIERLKANGP